MRVVTRWTGGRSDGGILGTIPRINRQDRSRFHPWLCHLGASPEVPFMKAPSGPQGGESRPAMPAP